MFIRKHDNKRNVRVCMGGCLLTALPPYLFFARFLFYGKSGHTFFVTHAMKHTGHMIKKTQFLLSFWLSSTHETGTL